MRRLATVVLSAFALVGGFMAVAAAPVSAVTFTCTGGNSAANEFRTDGSWWGVYSGGFENCDLLMASIQVTASLYDSNYNLIDTDLNAPQCWNCYSESSYIFTTNLPPETRYESDVFIRAQAPADATWGPLPSGCWFSANDPTFKTVDCQFDKWFTTDPYVQSYDPRRYVQVMTLSR